MKKNLTLVSTLLISTISLAQPVPALNPTAVDAAPEEAAQQSPIDIIVRPEIAGLWAMEIPENRQCLEYYNFKNANEMVIKSADEWSFGQYQYQPPADPTTTTAAILMLHIQYDNNQKDCLGKQEDQSNQIQQFFVKWNNAEQIQFCEDDKGAKCFATLNRQRP